MIKLAVIVVTTRGRGGADGRAAQAADDGAAQRRPHGRPDNRARAGADRATGERPIRRVVAAACQKQAEGGERGEMRVSDGHHVLQSLLSIVFCSQREAANIVPRCEYPFVAAMWLQPRGFSSLGGKLLEIGMQRSRLASQDGAQGHWAAKQAVMIVMIEHRPERFRRVAAGLDLPGLDLAA
jgi:hypothetical protein